MEKTRQLLIGLGHALAVRDRASINRCIEQLLETRTALAGTWKAVATAASRNGEHTLAIAAVERLVQEHPEAPQARLDLAAFLIKAGQIGRAKAIVEGLPDGFPSAAERNYLLGTLALNMGERDAALELLLSAAKANPSSGQIWLALANVPSTDNVAAIGDAVLEAHAGVSSRPEERAQYLHACGKVLADRGEHRPAFEAFAEAGELLARSRPFDMAAATRRADEMIREFDRALLDDMAASEPTVGSAPIFVSGMPRSGTTLVEHILSSEGTIQGGGELALFRLLHQDLGGGGTTEIRDFYRKNSLRPLAALYDHLVRERFPGAGRIIDKSLLAGNYMGLLMATFPEAPIIWMKRDPVDCGWSCFRTYFVSGLDWTNSQIQIAQMIRIQERLLGHWLDMAPGRILPLEFERLVSEPEPEIRRMAAHCGVPYSPSMLSPERSNRIVSTASTSQVREPINRQGVGSSQPYRQFLDPFLNAYEKAQS